MADGRVPPASFAIAKASRASLGGGGAPSVLGSDALRFAARRSSPSISWVELGVGVGVGAGLGVGLGLGSGLGFGLG